MNSALHSLDAAVAPSPASTDLGAAAASGGSRILYEGMDSPRFAADLERAELEAKVFAESWRGKLADSPTRPDAGETLAAAVKAYESLQDLTGRIMAYASLLYASDTSDAGEREVLRRRAGTGDGARRRPPVLRARAQPPRRRRLEAAMAAPALGHYRPWLEDIRKEKPHQLADEIEQLFLEKSVSGARGVEPAVRRHDVGPAVRLRRREPDARAAARQAPRPGRDEARGGGGTRSPRRLARTCASSRSSPTRSPRTRKSPTAGASSPTSPIRAISPIGSSARWSRRWLRR